MLVDSYLDTSFLWKLYVWELYSPEATAWLQGFAGSVAVSPLSDLELTSSLYRTFPQARAMAAQSDYARDLASGVFARVPVNVEVFSLALKLAEKHGGALKLRSLDTLHLAIAVHSGARLLATFDHRLARAAVLEGLAVVSFTP